MPDRAQTKTPGGWLARLRALPNDSPAKTLAVAISLCLVCSIAVSSAAVLLKPLQERNQALARKRNILEAAQLSQEGREVDELFRGIEMRVVELDTGRYVDGIEEKALDPRVAARSPELSDAVPPDLDIARIDRRPRYAPVYVAREDDRIATVVLPVYGAGLWGQMRGFIALEGDASTVAGLTFYEHQETPGLGAEVDNPAWKAQWRGKAAFDAEGRVRLRLIKGGVKSDSPDAIHHVDGLSGATLTANGVTNLVRYWLGDQGFGTYLQRLRTGEI